MCSLCQVDAYQKDEDKKRAVLSRLLARQAASVTLDLPFEVLGTFGRIAAVADLYVIMWYAPGGRNQANQRGVSCWPRVCFALKIRTHAFMQRPPRDIPRHHELTSARASCICRS